MNYRITIPHLFIFNTFLSRFFDFSLTNRQEITGRLENTIVFELIYCEGRNENMQVKEEVKSQEKLEDITGITCIYVPVNDVFESIKWYQKNLRCEPTDIHAVEPGMKIAILRFPDANGTPHGPTGAVPAIFLIESSTEGGRLGFTNHEGHRQAVGCFITPRIQDLFNRFKENGVNIAGDIRITCGPNLQFFDPDGNMWEVWQP